MTSVSESKASAKLITVRALLAKAESTEFEHEADRLRAKAYALMAQYGLEEALLNPSPEAAEGRIVDRWITIRGAYGPRKAILLNGLAKAMGCRTVRNMTKEKQTEQMHLFGHRSDVERVEILFTSLLVQLDKAVRRTPVPHWENTRSYRSNMILGWIVRVLERVVEAEDTVSREAHLIMGGSAQIILRDRLKFVNEAVEAAYKSLRTSAAPKAGVGYSRGYEEGSRATLGRDSAMALGR